MSDNILPFPRREEQQPEAECIWVDGAGVRWFKFCAEFEFEGNSWGFHIWARDAADAAARLAALKQTAAILGQTFAEIPG